MGAIHLLIPYGHTNIHNVFKMFYLRNQVLPKQILEHSGGHHEAWEVLKDLGLFVSSAIGSHQRVWQGKVESCGSALSSTSRSSLALGGQHAIKGIAVALAVATCP